MRQKEHNEYADKIYHPRKKLWLFFIILVFIAALSITFIIIGTGSNKVRKQEGQKLSRSISSLEDKYKNSNIRLAVGDMKGWSILENNENFEIKSLSNSCSFSTFTKKNVKDSIISGQTLDSVVNSELKQINDRVANQTLVINEVNSSFFESNKGKIEFLQKNAEYQSLDSGQHIISVYGQWIGQYQFIIVEDCKKADRNYSQSSTEELKNSIKLNIN